MSLQDQYGKLQQGQTFASLKFADDYLASGKLPGIHEDMATMMARIPEDHRRGALDLGACHGLLSIRAKQMGWSVVHGWEADQRSVDVYRKHLMRGGLVTMEAIKVDVRSPEFFAKLADTTEGGTLNTILARRILPELFVETYGKAGLDPAVFNDAGQKFGAAARQAGIEFMVIEGRQWKQYAHRGHANPLYRVENEIAALGAGWRVADRFKEVALVVPA